MARGPQPEKFDWEGFFLSFGIGAVSLGMSALFFWLVLTGSAKGKPSLTPHSLSQAAACLMPASAKEAIITVMAGLFGLFGLVCVCLGAWSVFRSLLRVLGLGRG